MAIASNFPAIRPSLDLNFAAGNFDPRITFSRASAATYYDGKTVAKAEENLFTNSDGPLQTVINGAVYNGDGTISFSAPANASFKIVSKLIEAGTQFTASVLLSGVGVIRFGALNGAGSPIGSLAQISLTSTPVKYYLTVFNTVYGSNCGLQIQGASDGSAATVKIEKYQFEIRDQATAYTPTTTQPITNYIPVLQTAPANVPRIDHDPVTGECKGLLIEEQRTNLLTYSENFNVGLGKEGASALDNVSIAPSGTMTATKLVESSANSQHKVYKNVTQPTAGTYTFSAYVKAAGRTKIQITEGFSVGGGCEFDLAAVTAASYTPGKNGSITPVGNGWFKVSVSWDFLANTLTYVYMVLMSGTSASYQGDGYSGIYIWGAQLEAGSFPTSYIKTEASQVTRAADSAQMTGANFSSWYRQDEGTFAQEFSPLGVSLTDRASFGVYESSGGFYTNSITVRNYGGSHMSAVHVNSISQAELTVSPVVVGGSVYKIACSYQSNYLAFARSGVSPAFSTSASIPVVNTLLFPGSGCQHIKRFAFYPKALPTYLQALTA